MKFDRLKSAFQRTAFGGFGLAFVLGASLLDSNGAVAQTVRAGEMALELTHGPQLSYLGVDVVSLEASLCNALPSTSTKDPKLVVANDGGHTGRVFGLDVGLAIESGGGTQISVDVTPGALSLIGPNPFVTACGSWSYRLSLDPVLHSPVSTLTLMRTRPVDPGGAFVGSIAVVATLELTPQGFGTTQWRTYNLTLNLAGTWALAPTSGRMEVALPSSASNLVFFAQKSGLAWVKSAQAASALSAEDPNSGQLVLQPTDETLGWLNVGRPR